MNKLLCSVLLIALFSSCTTPKRVLHNYLEDIRDSSFTSSVLFAEPVIQKNDLLSIQISSASLDPKADQIYNINIQQSNPQNPQMVGYLVDGSGFIELPRLGKIKAEGMKKAELEQVIKGKLQGLLSQPSVIIRFVNFRITVLGEVQQPGVLTIPTERLTILEAVGMTGGITEYGAIKNVRVLRELNGIRQSGLLDLTSKNIFNSPYYQLQQNDVVIVDQTDYRIRLEEQQKKTQQITFALTIVTTLAVLYNIFK